FNGASMSLLNSTGHADIVQAPDGQWWRVALGVRPQTTGDYNRETFLFPVTWEDEWPVFNHGQPLSTEIPGVLTDQSHLSDFYDDFTSETLDISYYFLRTPYKTFYSLTARPGFLRLNGTHMQSVIGITQHYYSGNRPATRRRSRLCWTGLLQRLIRRKAGATIFYGDFAHNDIGITGSADGSGDRFIVTRTIVVAEQVGPWALTTTNDTITTVGLSE
ncbi:hypothetical protein BT96DRAFT_834259, partial [Gymnopus androsaceus JB14]